MSHSAYIWELMERKGGWALVGRNLPVEARRSSEVVPPPEVGANLSKRTKPGPAQPPKSVDSSTTGAGVKYKQSVAAYLDQVVKVRQAKACANVGRDISIDELLKIAGDHNIKPELREMANKKLEEAMMGQR